MGGEEVLRIFALLVAQAFAGDGGMRRPERLTSGVSDQLLGQLSPDGKQLYYVSNRNTTVEIYTQDMQSGRARLLFDEGADTTWPRLSPDGKKLLYISYHDDAGGQLCVRDLPDRRRRCLPGTGALQAQWIDKTRMLLVSRPSLEGDLRVSQVKVGWFGLKEQALFDRNLSTPTVSPDGRWLVYVPVARYLPRVGPAIASRAAERLEAVRLDVAGAKPMPLEPDLPGLSGQPAFSADGKWLYFTQFFNDSNQDGEIDANDNGVLFRLPFDGDPGRSAAAIPQQLTDSSWSCQYPSPGALLLATCSRKNTLDVYSLPPDGEVPAEWSAERIGLEVDLSSRAAEELLLDRRLLERQNDVGGRRAVMMTLLGLHLQGGEFAAAEFYAQKIKSMPDKATAGAASALVVLVEHRKALRERERGRIDLEFLEESRRRLDKLSMDKTRAPAAILLRRVVRSEIADSIGDKDLARAELEAAPVEEVTQVPFLEAYYQRADALYRALDDRDGLVKACSRLANHPGLAVDDRLRFARAAVRARVRGLPYAQAVSALPGGDGELGFAMELQKLLLEVRDDNPPRELRAKLVVFYNQQTRLDRKRAVLLDAMQRAVDLDAEKLVEALAKLYVDDTLAGSGEHKRAERLYERAMLGRAYRRLSRGHLDKAQEAFAELAKNSRSLEAHLGYADLRLRRGASPEELEAECSRISDERARRVVGAFLISRRLPSLKGDEHERAALAALALLREARSELRGEMAAEVLHGELHHSRWMANGDVAAAQRANIHYLLALELASRNPRYRARILQQLALLQLQVGNYRIGLSYAEERAKLPTSDDETGLSQLLTHARILFHIDKMEEAGKLADAALAMVERTPLLAHHRALALDRAALYALGANHYDKAAALYEKEAPLVAGHNQLVVALARAAAEQGAKRPEAALAALDRVDAALPRVTLEWPHVAPDEVRRSYLLIAAGLRANAQLMRGDLDAAARALEKREQLALERFLKSDADEHLRAVALVEARLAALARRRHKPGEAARWAQAALGHSDDYVKRTGVKLHPDQLDLLRLLAELSLAGAPPGKVALPARLRDALSALDRERDPEFRAHERWMEIYSTLLNPKTDPPARAAR
jgi:WD40-like Beta Propeller Repeat